MQKVISIGIALATISAAASAGEEKLDNVLSGYEKTGENVNCLRLSMVRDTDPINDATIVFEVRGGAMYVLSLIHI